MLPRVSCAHAGSAASTHIARTAHNRFCIPILCLAVDGARVRPLDTRSRGALPGSIRGSTTNFSEWSERPSSYRDVFSQDSKDFLRMFHLHIRAIGSSCVKLDHS